MRKLLTFICLLWSASLMAQNKGQLYNEGKLYVSPHTLMTSESDFVNDTAGQYNNDGEVLLRGSFRNDGQAGFKKKGGLTRFEGFKIQDISGDRPGDYYNVLFKNDQNQFPFHLSGGMNIYGTVSFEQGIIDNKNYPGTFTFQSGADYTGAGDQSYVEGSVQKIGKETFTYPVGKKGYLRPAATVMGGPTSTDFGGEFLWKNSDTTGYPHDQKEPDIDFIDDQEYWTIDSNSMITDDIYVALTWRDVTTPEKILGVVENGSDDYRVVVVRWNEEEEKWVNEGGTKEDSSRKVTSDAVSGFGVFTLALLRTERGDVPTANDDNSIGNEPGSDVSILITDNDVPGKGEDIDPSTVHFIPKKGHCVTDDCKEVDVPDEGRWTVDENGRATFSPNDNFHKDPTPMDYTVQDKSGQESNQATISITYYARDFFIPNAFTPNGDGYNDVWKVYGSSIKEVYIMVYNQYGQKLFESRNVNVGWDGRYEGNLQPSGVYVYYARIITTNGKEVTKKGSITLIR